MTRNEAVKRALRGYARQAGIEIPVGFNINRNFGAPAVELTRRIQRKHSIAPTGDVSPRTLLVIGRWLPGDLGERAMWCMIAVEGALETQGNNAGPYIREIQKIGSELKPGAWPWCAATVSWAFRCAGWKSWAAFVRGRSEAYVPDWVAAAHEGRYGLRVVSWRSGHAGDVAAWQWDSNVHQHIGVMTSRANIWSGVAGTVEGNTSSGVVGSQDDGGGLWRRSRDVKPPHVVIRVS